MESKNRVWNIMGSGFFLLISAIAVIALIVAFVKDYRRKVELEAEIKAWQDKVALLHVKNNDLNNLITYYTSDEFVEKELRMGQNLKKPGEQVVVLPAKASEEVPDNAADGEIKSNWVKWWNYFFKE